MGPIKAADGFKSWKYDLMQISILIAWKLSDSFQAEDSIFNVLTKNLKEIVKKEMI